MLHPEVVSLLDGRGADATFPAEVLTDVKLAQRYLQAARAATTREEVDAREQVAEVQNLRLGSGVAVRVYRPFGSGPFPMFVYCHGGGWVVGNLEMHDELCRRIANRAAVVVVSVDYRLAPEHPFPLGLDDCLEAVTWASEHAGALHGRSDSIAVGGTSAGGNLAAALALRCRDSGGPQLSLQVLMYPVLDSRMGTRSYQEFAHGPVLDARQMGWYWQQYVPHEGDRSNPLASPSHASDLSGLPAAVIVIPACDPLRDEAEDYASRLGAAAVSVRLLRYPGQVHSFLRHLNTLTDADRAVTEISDSMRAVLAGAVPTTASEDSP
ncbi:MAG TPA: alpha/beta hydrolase [Acidimicrobiales bacterium]|nr:alpha/beta hydrolase [Acidimicrobiales bacterium]